MSGTEISCDNHHEILMHNVARALLRSLSDLLTVVGATAIYVHCTETIWSKYLVTYYASLVKTNARNTYRKREGTVYVYVCACMSGSEYRTCMHHSWERTNKIEHYCSHHPRMFPHMLSRKAAEM